jgi:hypothetical protein
MTDDGRSGSRWEPDQRPDEPAGLPADGSRDDGAIDDDGGTADAGDPA